MLKAFVSKVETLSDQSVKLSLNASSKSSFGACRESLTD